MSKIEALDELVVAQLPQAEAGWDYEAEIFGWEMPDFGTAAFHRWAKDTFEHAMAHSIIWATDSAKLPGIEQILKVDTA